jgi:hypothetical protein
MKTYTLVAVHDVRPLDWLTGRREPLPAEDIPECSRCGRRHAVVWTLSGSDKSILTVGCRCGARMLEKGLLPGVDLPAVARARAVDRRELADARLQLAKREALRLVGLVPAEMLTCEAPEPTWGPDRYGREGAWVACHVGAAFRCVEARSLELAAGEWGRETREHVVRQVTAAWRSLQIAEALTEAGAPARALLPLVALVHLRDDGEALGRAARAMMD